ncbi:MAG: hypothetical protein SFY80_11310 [Verrucomicrobiota bacterium]|nr:hypothetical protein [Verrucomicrobiota bacterium]
MNTVPTLRLPATIKSLITRMERIAQSKPAEPDSAGLTSLSYGEFELLCQQHGVSTEDRKLNQALAHRDWFITSMGLTYYGDLDIALSAHRQHSRAA